MKKLPEIVFTLVILLSMVANTAANSQKNIILILADDLGWADTTLYGKTTLYETPNLERLAARGVERARDRADHGGARHHLAEPARHRAHVARHVLKCTPRGRLDRRPRRHRRLARRLARRETGEMHSVA